MSTDLSLSDIQFANRDAEPASIAEWFLNHGVHVFPVHGKDPAVAKGTSWKDYRSADVRRLRDYGVPLSATLGVLDTDNRDDEVWVLQQIARDVIPATPFVVETARGFHRYYRLTGALPKFICRGGHTLEFRNEGQYVVGPGSRHPSGKKYAARCWSWRWEEIPFFAADFVFDDGSVAHTAGQVRLGARGIPLVLPDVVGEKFRHHTLHRLMRSLAAHGVPFEIALRTGRVVNATRCRPSLPDTPLDQPIGADFQKFLKRAYDQKDRANFTRTPKRGWELAACLLPIGLTVDETIDVVKAIDPTFDPETSA